MSGTPRTDFRPDPKRTQKVTARLVPEAQYDLHTILRNGRARSISEAIHRGLEREARAIRRRRVA